MKQTFTKDLHDKAKLLDGTILLPECLIDERVMEAAKYILKHNLSKISVIGNKNNFPLELKNNKNCKFFDIANYKRMDEMVERFWQLRKHKIEYHENAENLVKNTLDYFCIMLLQMGEVDGMVAGATWTTANTLRPALQVIKTAPTSRLVSGSVLMIKEGKSPLLFSDVSLNINPTSEELASIATDAADFYKKITNKKPVIAMLSFSTLGSGREEDTEKVREATRLVSDKYACLGEIQVDAALDKKTAIKKGVDPTLAGKCNVLIFPDINAGNIGYKLTARLGGYKAVGPIMLGLNKPVNDLSRGCTVKEIVDTVCITKLQIKK